MFNQSKRPESVHSFWSTDSERKTHADRMDEDILAASYPSKCPHQNSSPTPILDAHLRQANTKARLLGLRDALDNVIQADENSCIKCATTQAAGVLFLYLKDLREAKQNGEYSKDDKKAWKQEIKGLTKDLKREIKSGMKKSGKDSK